MNPCLFFINHLDINETQDIIVSMTKRKKKTKKKVVKRLEKTWDKGDNPIGLNMASPMSYEKYVKAALEIMSKRFDVRTYKLAPKEDYPSFIRGKDLRVQIWFDKKFLGYEFLVEYAFWVQSNRNKEERMYMREHANQHLKPIHDAVLLAKSKESKKKKNVK